MSEETPEETVQPYPEPESGKQDDEATESEETSEEEAPKEFGS